MIFYGFYQVLIGFSGFYWALIGLKKILLGFTGFEWVNFVICEFYQVLVGF